jgi:hypothetical protein
LLRFHCHNKVLKGDKKELKAKKRIDLLFEQWKVDQCLEQQRQNNVVVVCGDVTLPFLGLSRSIYDAIAVNLSSVVNSTLIITLVLLFNNILLFLDSLCCKSQSFITLFGVIKIESRW